MNCNHTKYDVIVIGGGPGGLAAACAAKKEGAGRVLVLERDRQAGGILNQCIHDGFGLIQYHKTLTGPEYADRAVREALDCGVTIQTSTMVIGLSGDRTVSAVRKDGYYTYEAGAVVLATGCRERTRGAVVIPGTRPAGVFTAGVVQNLVNIRNVMIGKRVVILGSGDIGLIMARRLTLEGAKVLAVVEIMPDSGGLQRNISQCLYDFGIPLYTGHTVSRILGNRKLTGVEISEVDAHLQPVPGTARVLPCDSLVLSVGLIPENELALGAGVRLDPKTNGTLTDAFMQTNVPGIFSCGNSHKVMDLADFVSAQGACAGQNAAVFCQNAAEGPDSCREPIPMIPWEEHRKSVPAKGIPQADTLTCILCPNGCQLHFEPDGSVRGNGCRRGAVYAEQERTAPSRTLTMTVPTASGALVPIRTDCPIPKDRLLRAADLLRKKILPDRPVRCGQVLYSNIEGANVIATADYNPAPNS